MANVTLWTQAATAILAALNASGAPATFYRARFEGIGLAETAGNVFNTKIDCKYECDNLAVKIDASFVIRVDVQAIPSNPNVNPPVAEVTVDLVADPIVLWAWRQIRFDPTLAVWNGGLQLVEDVYIDNIEVGYVDKSSSDEICVDITVRVEVEVDRNDPSINRTYSPRA